MRFPNTLDLNVYRAYISAKCLESEKNQLNALNLDWDLGNPDTLRVLCLKSIAENWMDQPYFREILIDEDRKYLLDILNLNYPLSLLCARIREDDTFWKRNYLNKWRNTYPINTDGKKWIRVYLEKHLSETIQNLSVNDYDQETMRKLVDLCSAHVRELKIEELQPASGAGRSSAGDRIDHIPFDIILSNLRELKKIDVTFDVKNAGNFFLGCATITNNDMKHFVKGLERCYELTEFRLHSNKLEPEMMKKIAKALDKGCPNLQSIEIPHCRIGDVGLKAFLSVVSNVSFPNLKKVVLTNNFLSMETMTLLAGVLWRRKIEILDLRLNPIMTEGAQSLFCVLNYMPIKELNLSCCSIDELIEEFVLMLIRFNKTIRKFDISSNKLGNIVGEKIVKIIAENSTLRKFDLRNTDVSTELKAIVDEVLLGNREKFNMANW